MLVCFSHSVFALSDTSISFSNPPKEVRVGDIVTFDIKVNSEKESMNAVSGLMTFPQDKLEIVSISSSGSLINVWTEEPKLKENKIPFEGVIVTPGFKGLGGLVFKVSFKAKKTGIATLSFIEGSILANDGYGTNILDNLSSVNFKISELKSDLRPVNTINNTISSETVSSEMVNEIKTEPTQTDNFKKIDVKTIYVYFPVFVNENFVIMLLTLVLLIIVCVLLFILFFLYVSSFTSYCLNPFFIQKSRAPKKEDPRILKALQNSNDDSFKEKSADQ